MGISEILILILKWLVPFVLVGVTAIPLIKYQLKVADEAIKALDVKFTNDITRVKTDVDNVKNENLRLISEVLEKNSADRDRVLETIAERFVSSLDSVSQATNKFDESFRRIHERLDEVIENNTANIRELERFMQSNMVSKETFQLFVNKKDS